MKKYMVLVLAALALLTACDNGADAPSKPEELAPVRIGLAGARSVLPAAPSLEDVDWFTLEGTASCRERHQVMNIQVPYNVGCVG